ncbi:hypothetical protein [Paraliomyxa miuraensis]|uniref:hypothetical protein n=1 Tax=Paraliomyxa miuraensis TaxID=376150 RepID=UPI00224EA1EB|nr:hypothetical protein [Paraliomyxa miuraensis]MCX4243568.1 hypothetical protein [Paraliomyxa miuraensis]
MRRAGTKQRGWTILGIGMAMAAGLSLTACSGGMNDYHPYASQPYGGGDDGDDEGETEADTDDYPSADLDGGGPPPPGDDGGVPPADNHGDCCVGNGSPGCDNKPVELCVCASDPWCCESEWDQACAALIEQLGCGHCNDEPPPPAGDDADCCAPHGTPGCDDAAIEACVCDADPTCCDSQWSAGCVAILELNGCGSCEPPPAGDTGGGPPPPGDDTGGGGPPPGGTGDCCAPNGSPGCDDAAIEACVCGQDAYCCDTEWDGVCVNEVDSFGCGTCGGGGSTGGGSTGGDGGGGPSACCQQQAGAGCPDDPVEACVCAVDDYCCNVFWDLTCVGEVESLGCGSC